ncbi:MAG: hypothetical protein ACI90V_011733, partial [Bacillariaceae sp.]
KSLSSSLSFALLDGIREDTKTGTQERITIEITQLPALFGRSHDGDTKNPNFFGLGKIKALSRKHCTIYYRDIQGGRIIYDSKQSKCVYIKPPSTAVTVSDSNNNNNNKTIVSNNNNNNKLPKPNPKHIENNPSTNFDNTTNLPTNGFFVIENLGKNRILVDLERIEQGDSIVLRSGSAIRYVLTESESKSQSKSLSKSQSESEHSGPNRTGPECNYVCHIGMVVDGLMNSEGIGIELVSNHSLLCCCSNATSSTVLASACLPTYPACLPIYLISSHLLFSSSSSSSSSSFCLQNLNISNVLFITD